MIYTIGHSTLNKDDFIKVAEPVDTILDVRSHPTSRWVHYHKSQLERWLPKYGKRYEWWPSMGGWSKAHEALIDKYRDKGVDVSLYVTGGFPKQRVTKTTEPQDGKPAWTVLGFYDYQWFMTLPEYHDGLANLIARGKNENIAIMCSEALWWKCHRSMISDSLLYFGHDSIHLQPKHTNHSAVISNRIERYTPEVIAIWDRWKE